MAIEQLQIERSNGHDTEPGLAHSNLGALALVADPEASQLVAMDSIEGLKEGALGGNCLVYEGLNPATEPMIEKRLILGTGKLVFVPSFDGSRPIAFAKGLFEHMSLPPPPDFPEGRVNEQSKVPSLLNLPNYWAFAIGTDAEAKLDGTNLDIRTLDMDHGVLTAGGVVTDSAGRQTDVTYTQFLDMHNPNQAVMRVRFRPHYSGEVTVRTGIDGSLDPGDKDYYKNVEAKQIGDEHSFHSGILYTANSKGDGHQIAIAQQARIYDVDQVLPIRPGFSEARSRRSWQNFTLSVESGKEYEMVTVSSIHTDVDPELQESSGSFPAALAVADIFAPVGDFGQRIEEHTQEWDKLWRKNSIKIVGDDLVQFGLKFNMFHLMAEVGNGSEQYGVGAKIGNAEDGGYNGHTFWDTDIFELPELTTEQRRSFLLFRHSLLPGAREKANKNGFKGAWYPWEAYSPTPPGVSGEGCPEQVYNAAGRLVPIKTLSESIHISADVAFATMKYCRETRDKDFLEQYGAEIVIESARFLASRAQLSDDGQYIYENVTGPDEYHEDVTNNAFTLLMAAHTLQLAEQLMQNGLITDGLLDKLSDLEGITKEALIVDLAHLREVRQNLYIPFDSETLTFSAFDGWDELIHVDLTDDKYRDIKQMDAKILGENPPPTDKSDDELTDDERNPVRRTDVIKQHDTVLALTLLGSQVLDFLPPDVRGQLRQRYGSDDAITQAIYVANYNKYAPQTSDGSSLSPSTTVLAHLKSGGDPDACYQKFRNLVLMDLSPKNTHETEMGLHTANIGASAWVATEGFMGIEAIDSMLHINPRLPSSWAQAERVISYFGQLLRVSIDQAAGKISVVLLDPLKDSIFPIEIEGKRRVLTEQSPHVTLDLVASAKKYVAYENIPA